MSFLFFIPYFVFTEANPNKGTKTEDRKRLRSWVRRFTEANPDKGTETQDTL